MKKLITALLAFLILFGSCGQDDLSSKCEQTCENESIINEFEKKEGLVRKVVIGPDSEGDSYNIYVIQFDDEIFVPCQDLIPQFQIDSTVVIFSGIKYSCCNLLTQPNWRTSFGCKFEITSIESQSDNL